MKRTILAVLCFLLGAFFAQADQYQSQQINVSGSVITITNSIQSTSLTLVYTIQGGPSTVSIAVQGCTAAASCTLLDTYTSAFNATRPLQSLSTAYSYFTVSATWIGGTNVSVTVGSFLKSPANSGGVPSQQVNGFYSDSLPGLSLNSNWSPVRINLWADSYGVGGISVSGGAVRPSAVNGGDAMSVLTGSFGANQWAEAKLASIAPSTTVVSITAATFSTPNVTYTYTLTSGTAPFVNEATIIAGMTNAGNNGEFIITAASGGSSGTFTVSDASGVTETGSSGTGNSPSDSNVGFCLRCTTDGRTGYFFIFGTNSYEVPGSAFTSRVWDEEIWKYVNGNGTFLVGTGPTTIPASVGDVYAATANGTTLTLWRNGVSVISTTDSTLTAGSPGLWTWSLSGPNEYKWANWTNTSLGNVPGNAGTTITGFQVGDTSFASSQIAYTLFDAFKGTTGTALATYNPSWTLLSGSTAALSSSPANSVTPTASGGGQYSGRLPAAQWAQLTLPTLLNGSTAANEGPAVCIQPNGTDRYNAAIGSAGAINIQKSISGTPTNIFHETSTFFANGDVGTLLYNQGIVTLLRNGMYFAAVSDSSLNCSNTNAGFWAGVITGSEFFSYFRAGSINGN